MIRNDVEIVDLDPLTWRNLGEVFPVSEWGELRLKKPGVLSILHESGRILRVDSPTGVNPTIPPMIENPAAMARAIHEATPGLMRVQIFEKASLIAFSKQVQSLDWRTMPSDLFYLRAWELAKSDPTGLCYYPRTPFLTALVEAATRLVAGVPDGGTLVLGIFSEGRPYFTLIARVVNQQIDLLTTFDTLVKYGLDTSQIPTSAADADRVLMLVEAHIGKVAHSLFCSLSAFKSMLEAIGEKQG
jgi:hypothetical protein